MKRIHFASLVLLTIIFVACDGGDGDDDPAPILPDAVAPKITINEPTINDSVLVIDRLLVEAEITDDRLLDNVRVVLTEPDGAIRVLSDFTVPFYSDYKKYDLSESHQIPKYAVTGDYIVTVEATDKGKNVGRETKTFTVHAPDINSKAFTEAFNQAIFSSGYLQTLDWYGYSPWDYGFVLDSVWFSLTMYLMVTSSDEEYSISKAEWDKFIEDFDVKSQSWTKWDENSDGNLNEAEFHNGISSLNLFTDWDKDNNKYIDFDEMAAGVFTRWDLNKNALLSREEYQEKFYSYLYRN